MVMLMKLHSQKYIPAVKETVKTHVEPHVQTLSTKAKEAYHASKSAVTPHIVKFQEHVDPYYQVNYTFFICLEFFMDTNLSAPLIMSISA